MSSLCVTASGVRLRGGGEAELTHHHCVRLCVTVIVQGACVCMHVPSVCMTRLSVFPRLFLSVTTSRNRFLALVGGYNTPETGLAQLVVNTTPQNYFFLINFKSASFLSPLSLVTLQQSLKCFFHPSLPVPSSPLYCFPACNFSFFYVFSVSSSPHREQEHISKEALILEPTSR